MTIISRLTAEGLVPTWVIFGPRMVIPLTLTEQSHLPIMTQNGLVYFIK
jgi:hypothetical protein